MHWDEIAVGLIWLLVAVEAYVAARRTRPDRNYHPLLRVLWATLGFVGAGVAVRSLLHLPNTAGSRAVFALALAAAVGYAIHFMGRRNRTPRYIALDIGGSPVAVDEEHLRRQSENITSMIRHGAAPASWVTGMEEACAEWRRLERWRRDIRDEVAARHAAREGAGR